MNKEWRKSVKREFVRDRKSFSVRLKFIGMQLLSSSGLIIWLCFFNSERLMTSFFDFLSGLLIFVFFELFWTPGKDWKMYSKWRENAGKVSISMWKSSIKGRNGYIVRRLTGSSVRRLIYWKSMMLRDTLEWFRYVMSNFSVRTTLCSTYPDKYFHTACRMQSRIVLTNY